MNIFRHLSEYNDPDEQQLALDWFAVGTFLNLIIAKKSGRKMLEHQARFVTDVRDSFWRNFENGSSQERKLLVHINVFRLASALSEKNAELRDKKFAALFEEHERIHGAAMDEDAKLELMAAHRINQKRKPLRRALEYVEHLGMSERNFNRVDGSVNRLRRETKQFWGYEVSAENAFYNVLVGLLAVPPEIADFWSKQVGKSTINYRSAVTGHGRQLLFKSAKRSLGLSEKEIEEEARETAHAPHAGPKRSKMR